MVGLEGLKKHEGNKIAAFLKKLDRSLRERLLDGELTEFSKRRLESLLKDTDVTLASIFNEYYDDLSGHLLDIGEFEASFEAQNLDQALKHIDVNYTSAIPSTKQLKAAIFLQPLSVRGADGGKLLEPFVEDWTKVEKQRLVGAILMGVAEGQTRDQIIRNIRVTKANQYRDGLLATTQRHAEAIVRTAVQHVSTVARTETLK